MTGLVVSGLVAGMAVGYVFQRADLCFHAAWRGLLEHRYHRFKTWLLGVALASVGLSALYATDRWDLNEGLPFRPQGNILGGLVIGAGMVIAASCTSGLFYKFGSGMLGAGAGLAAWFAGDVAANRWLVGRGGGADLRGSTVDLDGPTVADVLGVDRWAVSLAFLALVVLLLARTARGTATGVQWPWLRGGIALGAVTVLAWVLAGAGGASFGPSTVGAPASLVNVGGVDRWLVAFVVGIVPGSYAASRLTRTFRARGEAPVRYAQLAAGGALLGAGGQIGGGCNLGHGLSGAAQLNVSSWVVVASIIAGIGIARAVQLRVGRGAMPASWSVHPAGA